MRQCFIISINKRLLHSLNYMQHQKFTPIVKVYFTQEDAQHHVREIPPPKFVYPLQGFHYLEGILMMDLIDLDLEQCDGHTKILSLRDLVFLCRAWHITDPSQDLRVAMQEKDKWKIRFGIGQVLETWWNAAKDEMSDQQHREFWRFLNRNPYEITEVELA